MTTAVRSKSGGRLGTIEALQLKLVELWRARELLRQFVGKELKVRYKNSALGFLWSLVTPILMTAVFTVVFQTIIRVEVGGSFAAFFIGGYLVWQFFQNSSQAAIGAIVGNGPLVKKVYFPREILPLSVVAAQVVHLLLALLATYPFLVLFRGWGVVARIPAVLLGVVLVSLFTAGVSMLLAAANVTFRDLQELIVVIFLVWFYATPIIYPEVFLTTAVADGASTLVQRVVGFFGAVLAVNPMTWFVRLIREASYGVVSVAPEGGFTSSPPVWPNPLVIGICAAWAVGAFVLGYVLFQRRAATFAKEI